MIIVPAVPCNYLALGNDYLATVVELSADLTTITVYNILASELHFVVSQKCFCRCIPIIVLTNIRENLADTNEYFTIILVTQTVIWLSVTRYYFRIFWYYNMFLSCSNTCPLCFLEFLADLD